MRVTIERSESSIATARSASVSARSKGSDLVAAVGDRSSFKNERQFAAWLGLAPKQRSSGGRVRLCGISEDRYLRTLLIPRCPLDVNSGRSIAWDECCAPGRSDAFEASFRNGRSWRDPSVAPTAASPRIPAVQIVPGIAGRPPNWGGPLGADKNQAADLTIGRGLRSSNCCGLR